MYWLMWARKGWVWCYLFRIKSTLRFNHTNPYWNIKSKYLNWWDSYLDLMQNKISKHFMYTYSLATMYDWIYALWIVLVLNHIFERFLLVQWPCTWTMQSTQLFVYWIPFGPQQYSFAQRKQPSVMNHVMYMTFLLCVYVCKCLYH